MAETTTTNKMFLDKVGLGIFWGIIKEHLATKADKTTAVGSLSLSNNEATTEKDKTQVTINVKAVDGSTNLTPVVLTAATTSRAGLMSATDKNTLDTVAETVKNNTNFKGLALDTTPIANEKAADLALKLENETINGTDGEGKDVTIKKSYIVLYDKNTEAAEAKLDVSDFVKNSVLNDSSIVIIDGKTHIELKFDLANGDTKSEYIDVSNLIDVYTAGEGLTKTDNTFKLVAATDAKLGGIKTGYTAAEGTKNYAVKVDGNGNAYVAVPWQNDNTEYTAKSGNTYVELKLTGTEFSIDETKLATDIEGLKTSKADNASGDTYVNATKDGTTINVSATDALKNAVTAANSAVQTAEGDTYVNASVSGKKVSVSATTALTGAVTNANSALQEINIGSIKLTKNSNTVEHNTFVSTFAMTEADIRAICV